MATPSFVNVTNTTGSTTSTVTNKPTSTADGDLLVCFFASSSINATITAAPTGWVKLHTPWRFGAFDYMEVWGKIASGEPSSWTWTTSVSGQTGFIIQAWHPSAGSWSSPNDAVVAIDYSNVASGNVTPAYPSLAIMSPAAIDHALLTALVTRRGDGTITQPTSHTKAGQILGGGFDNGALIKFSTSYRVSSAATPPTGNWAVSTSRDSTLFSIEIRDPTVAKPTAVSRFYGDRSDGNFTGYTSTPINVTRPLGSLPGDTEVIVLGYRGTVYANTPTGYVSQINQVNASTTPNTRVSVFTRVLDGTESDTVSVSWSSAPDDGVYQVYAINSTPFMTGSAVVDTSSNTTMDLPTLSTPASLTPGTVYIAGVVLLRNDGSSVTSAPTGFQLMGRARQSLVALGSCRLASACKLDTAANAGPATFPLASSYTGIGFMLGVGISASTRSFGYILGG